MWVDIIVLSILSALISGPLVIQRQVKALLRLGLFGSSEGHPPQSSLFAVLVLQVITFFPGVFTVFTFVSQGTSDKEMIDLVSLAINNIAILSALVPTAIFGIMFVRAVASLIDKYYSRYLVQVFRLCGQ